MFKGARETVTDRLRRYEIHEKSESGKEISTYHSDKNPDNYKLYYEHNRPINCLKKMVSTCFIYITVELFVHKLCDLYLHVYIYLKNNLCIFYIHILCFKEKHKFPFFDWT